MLPFLRLFTGAALCAALATAPSVVSQAAGKRSPPPPFPANDYSMGGAPENCPTTTLVHPDHPGKPSDGWWVGGEVLAGYSGWIVHEHRVFLYPGAHTAHGYPDKVFWQLIRGARGPVRVRGWNLRTGKPIWFGTPLDRAGFRHVFVRHVMVVIPQPRSIVVGPHGRLDYTGALDFIFIPSAGCFGIRADWKTGSWTAAFAAGCMPKQVNRRLVGVARCK